MILIIENVVFYFEPMQVFLYYNEHIYTIFQLAHTWILDIWTMILLSVTLFCRP